MTRRPAQGRRGRIVWTRDLKLGLHILNTEYGEYSGQAKADVFNTVFRRHLSGCGVHDATVTALNAQWYERKKPNSKDWSSICATTSGEADGREALRLQIQDALTELGLGQQSDISVSRKGKTSRSSAHVRQAIGTSVQVAQRPPSTPIRLHIPYLAAAPKSPKSPRTPKSIKRVPIQRNDGTIIRLPEHITFKPMKQVPAWEAHPPLPAVLFRYWTKDPNCDRDSEEGFTARKYYKCNVTPPGPPMVDLVDVYNHMDRKMVDTPFISTCDRLYWIVQLLVKRLEEGDLGGRLSLIDTNKLARRAVFHAQPHHREIKKSYAFTEGAYRYSGQSEFLVWHRIPKEAIIRTVKAQDLIHFAESTDLRTTLRLDILRMRRTAITKKAKMLRDGQIVLTPRVVASLSTVCIFLGLDASSPIEHLSHIVRGVVEGWGLQVDRHEPDDWYRMATIFANHLSAHSNTTDLKNQESCKLAFLTGVQWSRGELHASHSSRGVATKNRRARKIGLENPAKLVANQLDAAKLAVLSYEKMETRRLERHHEQRLLQASVKDSLDGIGEFMDVGDANEPFAAEEPLESVQDVIFYEDDDDGENEDGFVV